MGWPPNTVKPGDPVLVWGGSGGLGSMAIQIVKQMGGIPIAVVSSEDKFEFCMKLGAKGCINRKDFDHWGMMPHWTDTEAYNKWAAGARAVGAKIWEVLGERKSPRIVFDHPGEDTVPTSIFVCRHRRHGGDLRRHVRLQRNGRPALPVDAAEALPGLALRERRAVATPSTSWCWTARSTPAWARRTSFDQIGLCHQLMFEGKQPLGVMAALVSAPRTGLKDLA